MTLYSGRQMSQHIQPPNYHSFSELYVSSGKLDLDTSVLTFDDEFLLCKMPPGVVIVDCMVVMDALALLLTVCELKLFAVDPVDPDGYSAIANTEMGELYITGEYGKKFYMAHISNGSDAARYSKAFYSEVYVGLLLTGLSGTPVVGGRISCNIFYRAAEKDEY